MAFPVPKQLITNEAETITRRKIPSINRKQTFHPDPIYTPFRRPPENLQPNSPENKPHAKPKIDVEFEENSSHQEGIISEFYQRSNKSYFQEPKDLESLVNTSRLVQKHLPKQADIDEILKIIQWKVLIGMHLSVMVKGVPARYLSISYFKDIYLYLAQNKSPSAKAEIRKVGTLVEKNILLDSLLYKIVSTPDKEMVLLAIPETCVDSIIAQYNSSLFVGHWGVIKTYLNISESSLYPI